MNPEKQLKFKKANRLVLCCVVPLLAAAAVCYAVFAPAVFQLNEDYYFTRGESGGGDLRAGGRTLLRDVRLWGRYPYVYGSGLQAPGTARVSFLLDLKENNLRTFSDAETESPGNEFDAFLLKNGADLSDCRTWHELFEPADGSGKITRQRLKKALETPSGGKKYLFF